MKKNTTLLLILATTFCPLLIAGVLTHESFSSSLGKKQNGTFLDHEYYLPNSRPSQETQLSQETHLGQEAKKSQEFKQKQWQLLISTQLNGFDKHYDKLNKIKTALGKRSTQVVITKFEQDEKLSHQKIYIAAPNGHVLLAYQKELVGKPLYKDLSHLIRSNEK
jgi:hypothetical protein